MASEFCPQFYSWYLYPEKEEDFGKSVSSAEYIDNVNDDAVIIVDGLTKVSPPTSYAATV